MGRLFSLSLSVGVLVVVPLLARPPRSFAHPPRQNNTHDSKEYASLPKQNSPELPRQQGQRARAGKKSARRAYCRSETREVDHGGGDGRGRPETRTVWRNGERRI